MCVGVEISPNETIERDEIVISEKEYINASLFAHIHSMCHSMAFRNINIMSYCSSNTRTTAKLYRNPFRKQ